MRIYLLLMILTLVIMFGGCIRQTRTPVTEIDASAVVSAMQGAVRITEMKGFGELTAVNSGQRLNGKIDAAARGNSGYIKAQAYTSFGSAIATISAEDFSGRANFNREVFEFNYSDVMSNIPISAARRLTYGQFISTLTGSMPGTFWELSANPDTLIRSRRGAGVTAAWISDTLTVRAQINPKTGGLGTVTFIYTFEGDNLSMRFGNFRRGVPYEISVRESSRNYIQINYENIVWK